MVRMIFGAEAATGAPADARRPLEAETDPRSSQARGRAPTSEPALFGLSRLSEGDAAKLRSTLAELREAERQLRLVRAL